MDKYNYKDDTDFRIVVKKPAAGNPRLHFFSRSHLYLLIPMMSPSLHSSCRTGCVNLPLNRYFEKTLIGQMVGGRRLTPGFHIHVCWQDLWLAHEDNKRPRSLSPLIKNALLSCQHPFIRRAPGGPQEAARGIAFNDMAWIILCIFMNILFDFCVTEFIIFSYLLILAGLSVLV